MEQIDDNIMAVNREYSNTTYRIKKEREKIGWRQAKLYTHQQRIPKAARKIIDTLTMTQTKYPDMDMVLLYKTATI